MQKSLVLYYSTQYQNIPRSYFELICFVKISTIFVFMYYVIHYVKKLFCVVLALFSCDDDFNKRISTCLIRRFYTQPCIYFNLCFAFFNFPHRNFGLVTKTLGKLMEYKLFSYVYKSFESGTIMFFFCCCFFLRVCDEKSENATFLKHFRADIFEDANFPYSLPADVNGCVLNRDDVTLSEKLCHYHSLLF